MNVNKINIYYVIHHHDHQQELCGFQEILEDPLNYFLRYNYVKLDSTAKPLNHYCANSTQHKKIFN